MNDKMLMKLLSITELVDQFAEACVAQDEALFHDKIATFNKAYRRMNDVQKELRQRGQAARLTLIELYGHPNIQVRLQAAIFTLAVAPLEARQVIEWIARSGFVPQMWDARGILRALDEGTFKPD